MGLFGKIKNIFYDEEIVEVPVEDTKKDESPRIEEVRLPKREVVKPVEVTESPKPVPPVYTERELFKTENSFKFPVIDEDEEEIEPVRTRTRPSILDMEMPSRREVKEPKQEIKYNDRYSERANSYKAPKAPSSNSQEKVFRPSPVISPVYGVLDKNYKKEEIIERQHSIRHNPSDMNYDSVRRKAYGTLEDELENTLSKISSRTNEVMQTIEEVENLDTESNSKSIEDLLNEIEENHGYQNISIGELEEKIKDQIENDEEDTFVKQEDEFKKQVNHFEDNSQIQEDVPALEPVIDKKPKEEKLPEEDETGFDKTLEHDLFNLIDSMYEEREGE